MTPSRSFLSSTFGLTRVHQPPAHHRVDAQFVRPPPTHMGLRRVAEAEGSGIQCAPRRVLVVAPPDQIPDCISLARPTPISFSSRVSRVLAERGPTGRWSGTTSLTYPPDPPLDTSLCTALPARQSRSRECSRPSQRAAESSPQSRCGPGSGLQARVGHRASGHHRPEPYRGRVVTRGGAHPRQQGNCRVPERARGRGRGSLERSSERTCPVRNVAARTDAGSARCAHAEPLRAWRW